MKFEEFISEYKNIQSEAEKQSFLRRHIVRNYIPLEQKEISARSIVKSTNYDDNNGIVNVNTVAYKMFYFISLIKLYTDIDANYKEGLNLYNQLKENNVIELFDSVKPLDVDEYREVCRDVRDDFIQNHRSTQSILLGVENRFAAFLEQLVKEIDNNPELLNQIKNNLINK